MGGHGSAYRGGPCMRSLQRLSYHSSLLPARFGRFFLYMHTPLPSCVLGGDSLGDDVTEKTARGGLPAAGQHGRAPPPLLRVDRAPPGGVGGGGQWWNVLGCAGAQFQLEEVAAFLPLYRLFTVFLLLISFPTYLGFVILLEIIAVLAVLTCFTKCMTKCSRGRQIKEALAFPFLAAAYPAGLISFIISICLGLSISLVLLLLVLLLILPPVLLARKACNSSKPTNEELRRVVMLPIKIVTTFFKNIN
mmetsp:Transcript_17559/g.26508  ORF Transcript_17559/g.26508 Transcript_17559/m.26508 type:complete len:248 (+) Transcript_17559:390-1133(+)